MNESETIKNNTVAMSLFVLSALAVTAALYFMRPVLIPFGFSLFLYFSVSPLVRFLSRRGLHQNLAIAAGTIVLVIIFSVIGYIFVLAVKSIIANYSAYSHEVHQIVDALCVEANRSGIPINAWELHHAINRFPLTSFLSQYSGFAIEFLGHLVLIFIFTLFFILGSRKEVKIPLVDDEVKNLITRYFVVKFFVSVLVGVIVGVSLSILNIQFAVTFGILTFLLNFIPNLGSVVAVLLPLPIAFVQFGLGVPLLLAFAIPTAAHFVIGNILDPMLMGENLGLHPITILFGLAFWGIIWGLPGMFLSAPITAIIKVLLARYDLTKSFAKLMEGT